MVAPLGLAPLAISAAKGVGVTLAGMALFEGAGRLGSLFTEQGGARDRAAFAQAGLNQLSMLGISQRDPTGSLFGIRDQFLADTVGQSNTRMGRMTQAAGEAAAFRDIMFGRANLIRQASIQSQPHPLELLAGLRSFTNG
jgi:hypothetical protein